jgi:threonyl-tRNA synthetase
MISNSLVEKVVVAKVRYTNRIATLDDGLINPDAEKDEGEQWTLYDSFRPLEGDCELKLLNFEELEGKMTFWHSSAHVLGECMEREFGVHLCHGPPTDSGFFYDAYSGNDVFINFIILTLFRFSIMIITRSLNMQPQRL